MSFKTIKSVLGADLATAGTVTLSYPNGTSRGDFLLGLAHKASVQNLGDFVSPRDFTLTFNASNITFTWKAANTVPSGSTLQVQVDQIGGDRNTKFALQTDSPKRDVGLNVELSVVFVSLGQPAAKVATSILNAVAATGAPTVKQVLSPAVALDFPRNLEVKSSTTDTTQTVRVFGTDVDGAALSEDFVLNGVTAVVGNKAFAKVTGYKYNINLAGTLSIGSGSKLGLPVAVPSAICILKEIQDAAAATAGALTVADNNVPSATTGDVRGTYLPNTVPDGAKGYALVLALGDVGYQGAPQFSA